MIQLSKKYKNHFINCTAFKIGSDWNISIYGGDTPHIGATALGIAIKAPYNNNKISSSVSLITVPGHKEDQIVLKAASILAKKFNTTVLVCCGIHIDNISLKEINEINTLVDQLIAEILTNNY